MIPVPQLLPALVNDAGKRELDRDLLLMGDVDYDQQSTSGDQQSEKKPRRYALVEIIEILCNMQKSGQLCSTQDKRLTELAGCIVVRFNHAKERWLSYASRERPKRPFESLRRIVFTFTWRPTDSLPSLNSNQPFHLKRLLKLIGHLVTRHSTDSSVRLCVDTVRANCRDSYSPVPTNPLTLTQTKRIGMAS